MLSILMKTIILAGGMQTLAIGQHKGMPKDVSVSIVNALTSLPAKLEEVLAIESDIKELAEDFTNKEHTFFLVEDISTLLLWKEH